MAEATTSAIFGSSDWPESIVRFRDLKTSFGKWAFIDGRPKTFEPKSDWIERSM